MLRRSFSGLICSPGVGRVREAVVRGLGLDNLKRLSARASDTGGSGMGHEWGLLQQNPNRQLSTIVVVSSGGYTRGRSMKLATFVRRKLSPRTGRASPCCCPQGGRSLSGSTGTRRCSAGPLEPLERPPCPTPCSTWRKPT